MFINFVTAFHVEAKPLINHYGLKPLSPQNNYPIFANRECTLIISGSGKEAAANASDYLYQFNNATNGQIWINIGIAGHRDMKIGSTVIAHKIIDSNTGQCWYPAQTVKHKIKTVDLYSVDQPESEFTQQTVYDMEASGFYRQISKATSRELAQCIKVISDNHHTPAGKNIAKIAEKLIGNATAIIAGHIHKLQLQAQPLTPDNSMLQQQFFDHWHFTVSQQHQLHKHLQRLSALQPKQMISINQYRNCAQAADVIKTLSQKIDSAGKQAFCDD